MAKQTFTVGQVLTAAQMTSLQQTAMGGGSTTAKTASYVLVAADAGTVVQMNSASATTITVNTALFAAGDTVQIQNVGAGVCTVTAGTATVSTSSTLALKQYDAGSLYFNSTSAAIFFATDAADSTSPLTTKGDLYTFSTLDARLPVGTNNQTLVADSTASTGLKWATPASSASGLTKISQTTFTTTASVSVNGCFTSTYTNYIVVIDNLKPASNASNVLLQFQYSTSTVQATGYTSGASYMTGGGVSGNYNVNNGASSIIGNFTDLPAGNVTINISGVGASSQRAFFNGSSNGGNSQGTVVFGGLVDSSQTYTGIKLTTAAATMSGSVTVYGLAI